MLSKCAPGEILCKIQVLWILLEKFGRLMVLNGSSCLQLSDSRLFNWVFAFQIAVAPSTTYCLTLCLTHSLYGTSWAFGFVTWMYQLLTVAFKGYLQFSKLIFLWCRTNQHQRHKQTVLEEWFRQGDAVTYRPFLAVRKLVAYRLVRFSECIRWMKRPMLGRKIGNWECSL